MKALHDKTELKQRNTAYKVTLEYCPETCDDVDLYASLMLNDLQNSNMFDTKQMECITLFTNMLIDDVKDVGTRKLRHAFTTYVLENTTEKE